MAFDNAGAVWEIFTPDGTDFGLAKYSGGVMVASATLPNGVENANWSLNFDQSDNAYAVGAASDTNYLSVGLDLAVYKVSAGAGGGVLLSSATLNNPIYNKDDMGFGSSTNSAGEIWIAGIQQTGGNIGDNDGSQTYAGALWKYNMGTGVLSGPTTTFFGLIAGTVGFGDVKIDNAQNLWVLGTSSNPATDASDGRKMDLFLAKYDPTGASLISQSSVKGFHWGLDFVDSLSLAISTFAGGPLYATGARMNTVAGLANTDLAFIKFTSTGGVAIEKYWHNTVSNSDDAGQKIAINPYPPSGNIFIVGEYSKYEDGQATVWHYTPDGTLVFAESLGSGNIHGIAIDANNNKYLAGGSTYPIAYTPFSGIDLVATGKGAEGPQAAPIVLGSAITFPAGGATITGLTTISGTASQASAVEVSIQGPDGQYWNGSSYGTLQTWLTAAGTNNWSLIPSFGVNSVTGTYAVASRAKDSGGMYQSGTTSISVFRQPTLAANITVLSRSSTSFEVAFTPNGNPLDQKYHFHYSTAPSCGEAYFNGCPPGLCNDYVSGTTRTISVGYGNASLSPNTSYFFQIHTEYDGTGGVYIVKTGAPGMGSEPNPPTEFCGGGEGGGGYHRGGDAVAFDASGNLWEVIAEADLYRLSKFTSGGSLVFSVSLPSATESGKWRVHFDASGNAYAVGGSTSPTGDALAIYKVSSAGALISSRTYANTLYNNHAYHVGSDTSPAGDIWIAGALQTYGPKDWEASGEKRYAAALWNYNMATGDLAGPTTTFYGLYGTEIFG
ncbi:MAG: hypothetical protein AABZ63_04250, partial [Actinomycetota bacterium]